MEQTRHFGNKPTRTGSTYFSYGPDHARFKQVNGDRTTYYINGGLYEEIIEGAVTTTKSYVGGYLVRAKTAAQIDFTYLHKDHLGSVEAMTDQWGNLIDRMSFDPWGQRQYADWPDGDPTGGDPGYYPTTRGYTGHEMLDHVNLVHMNGRVYDPVIGRFLSPDLMIQAPYNTQSFNRYSYVMNNPLSLVDPSGYESETDNDHRPGWKPGGGQGGGPTEEDKKKVEEDMKKLQEFVDQNSNFDSVDEVIQEYKENGFAGVQFRSVFGEEGSQEGNSTSSKEWNTHKVIETLRVGVDYTASEGIPLEAKLISTKEIKGTYDSCCSILDKNMSIRTLDRTSATYRDIRVTTEYIYGPSSPQCGSACQPYSLMNEPTKDFSTMNSVLEFLGIFKSAPR